MTLTWKVILDDQPAEQNIASGCVCTFYAALKNCADSEGRRSWARMCKRGPKLTVVRHMPNHPALHRVLRQSLQECATCFTHFVLSKNHLTYIACWSISLMVLGLTFGKSGSSEIHVGNRRTLTQCDAFDWDPACTSSPDLALTVSPAIGRCHQWLIQHSTWDMVAHWLRRHRSTRGSWVWIPL